MNKTMYQKIWDAHVVEELPGGNALIFVDRIVAHEPADLVATVEAARTMTSACCGETLQRGMARR